MLKKDDIKKMAGYLKIKEADLEKAITDEKEVEMVLPEITTLTADELTARDTNKIAEGKTAAKTEAETEVNSLWKKELSKKLNTEIKGERIGDVAKELQTLINADGNEKLTTLQEQNRLLLADKEALTGKITTLETEKGSIAFERDLIGSFPANRSKTLKDTELLTLLRGELTFEDVDGKKVAKRNGEIVKDPTTHAPLPVDKVVADYFTERNWIDAGSDGDGGGGGDKGGRGGGNSGGGNVTGVKTMSQAVTAWKAADPENNKNEMSPEFTEYVGGLAKADPQFDMYK